MKNFDCSLRNLFSVAVLVTVTVLAFNTPSYPQVGPTNIFELDGNTIVDTTGNCDWNPLNSGLTANTNTPAARCAENGAIFGAYGFLVGSPGEPAFTSGGSKDSNDIPSWAWSVTSTPDKDTLTHGYAASYSASGDNLLVFGAERFAVNGDSNIGIWFFQNQVGLTGASKGGFTGTHRTGDILIVSAFTAGGGASTISVYQWNPGACPNSHYSGPTTSGAQNPPVCAATNLLALFFDTSVGSTAICTDNIAACALVNSMNVVLSWPYTAKFGVGTNTVPTGGFYEGGIDLTYLDSLVGGVTHPCFASFLFETRSSQSLNAVLKDFLVGSFPQCHISVTKACACTSFSSSQVQFHDAFGGTVTNDGGGTLFNVTVTDQGNTYSCGTLGNDPANNANVIFFGDATIQPGSPRCTRSVGTADTFASSTLAATNVAGVVANTTSDTTSTTVSNTTGAVSCDTSAAACTPAPGITVTKQCVTTLENKNGFVVVRVDYTGTVTNTGNVRLASTTVTDAASGSPSTATFGPFANLDVNQSVCYTNGAATCPTITPAPTTVNQAVPTGAASYYPNALTHDVGIMGRAEFEDTVTATGTDIYGNAVPKAGGMPIQGTGKCLICPFGYCPSSNPSGTN